jgi:fructose/tagatose bisphosphate aldolase
VKKTLVTNKEVLSAASAAGYAVGAFNINNMEILQPLNMKKVVQEKTRLFGILE